MLSKNGNSLSAVQRNILVNYLGQAWVAIMGIVFLPVFIKYLGMEAYGLIGVFTLMQSWLALLDMGMTPTLNREMARYTAGAHDTKSIKDLLRSLEIICYSVAFAIAMVVLMASNWLATDWLKVQKLPIETVAQSISIMAFVVALRFIEGIYRGSLFGLQKQVWFNSVSALLATFRQLGAVAILALVSPTIHAFFIWQVLVSLITVLSLGFGVHNALPITNYSPKFSRAAISGIWKFAGGMIGITILSILLTQIDKVLLSKLLTLENFGFYILASTLASVLYMLVGPVTQAIYPRMVELVTLKDQDALISIYHKGCQLITVLAAPLAILLSIYAQGVIFAWSGNTYIASQTAPILSALILGTFFNGLMYMPYQLQLAYGWTSFALKMNTVAVVLLVPAIFYIVPRYGAIGAASIWLALNTGYVLIAMQLMHRRLLKSEKLVWYFFDVLLPIVGVLIVVLISEFFKPLRFDSRMNWLVFLGLTGVSSLLVSVLFSNQIRPLITWDRCMAILRVKFKA